MHATAILSIHHIPSESPTIFILLSNLCHLCSFFFNQFHNPKDLNPIPIDFLDLYLLPSVGFHTGVLDDPDCRPQGCNCGFPSGSPRLFRSHATGSLQPEIAQQGLPNFRGRGYRICYDGSSSGTALRTSRSNAPRAMESPGGWKYRLYLLLEP